MAKSGSFNTSGYDGRYLQFSWGQKSQSVADNTTTISWTLKGAGTGGATWYYSGNFKVVIDGKTVYQTGSNDRIQLRNGTTVASGTFTFTHTDAGIRSFAASVQAGIYTYAVNCSGQGSFALDTIARASQPSCITWPEHTQNVGSFGDTISIHMNRKSDAFTHTVSYAFGSRKGICINADTGQQATGVTTGIRWLIPKDLMEVMPSSLSGSGTIYVDTYNGSTLVGTKYCGFTATVPTDADCYPSVTATLEDVTGIDDLYGKPVQGLSKIKVTLKPSPVYKSPIAQYFIWANGVKYDTAEATTDLLQKSGSSQVRATVTDKRGRTSVLWTYSMNVLAYTAPQITALSVHRVDAAGEEDDQGNFIHVTFSARATKLSASSTVDYILRYKKSSATQWSTANMTAYKNNFTVTDGGFTFAADSESPYDVEIEAKDPHSSTTRSTSASTAFALMDWYEDGTGLRFGGLAELSRTLQNDLSLKQVGNRYAFSSPGTANTAGFVRMARISITAANADTPLTFVFTRRAAQAPMTVHVALKNSTMDSSSVASIRYEGDNYGAFLAPGEDDLTWDLYVQKGSTWDTITLQDWWMSLPMQSRVQVSFPGNLVDQVPNPYYRATPAALQSLMDFLMPVGFILTQYNHNDPNEMYPGTTWARLSGGFLWAVDANGTIGQTGGAREVTLTVNQLPQHSHGSVYSGNAAGTKTHAWLASGGTAMAYGTVEAGGGQAHNNMPPYIQVSIWRRTA